MDRKRCARCQELKALEEFGRLGETGHQAYCKTCRAAYYQDNKHRWRQSDLKRRYNISLTYYNDLLASQGGVCAICSTTEPGGRGAYHVDHDHSCCQTGAACGSCVRGLLCHGCNLMLGVARDSVRVLESAAEYLRLRRTIDS